MLVIACLGPAVAALFYTYASSAIQPLYFGSKIVIAALPVAWWVFAERRARVMWVPASTRSILGWGLATGIVISIAILASEALLLRPYLDPKLLRTRIDAFGLTEHYWLFVAFIALVNSAYEEYYWRWFVFGRLLTYMRPLWAATVGGVAFALHHFIALNEALGSVGMAALLSFGVALGGIIWSWQYYRSGRLVGVWVSHILADVVIFWLLHQRIAQ